MNKTQEQKLKALASELAQDIKTGEDLSALSSTLKIATLRTQYIAPIFQPSCILINI